MMARKKKGMVMLIAASFPPVNSDELTAGVAKLEQLPVADVAESICMPGLDDVAFGADPVISPLSRDKIWISVFC